MVGIKQLENLVKNNLDFFIFKPFLIVSHLWYIFQKSQPGSRQSCVSVLSLIFSHSFRQITLVPSDSISLPQKQRDQNKRLHIQTLHDGAQDSKFTTGETEQNDESDCITHQNTFGIMSEKLNRFSGRRAQEKWLRDDCLLFALCFHNTVDVVTRGNEQSFLLSMSFCPVQSRQFFYPSN